MKLGGEFEVSCLEFSRSSNKAAQLFLGATKIVCSEAFKELCEIAKKMRIKIEEVKKTEKDEKSETFSMSGVIVLSYIMPMIREWLQKYHLQNSLLAFTVCATLEKWAKNPQNEGKEIFPALGVYIGTISPDPPPAWNPSKEPWNEYLKKIEAYRPETEKKWIDSAEAAGFHVQRIPSKRKRSGDDPLIHFKWFALYQMKGYTYEMIAQSYTDEDPTGNRVIGEDTVRKAVQEIAKLLYIPLRK